MSNEKCNKKIDSQLELFVKINSSLDDVDSGVNRDHEGIDPVDNPYSTNYRSKVVCPINDIFHGRRDS